MEAKDSLAIPPAPSVGSGQDDEVGKSSLEEDEEAPLDIEEEVVEEMIRWLQREISGGGCAASSPGSVAGESCGASFSDAASTVMASVDTRGAIGGVAPPFFWPAAAAAACSGSPEGGGGPWDIVRMVEEEDDGGEGEWLAHVLGGTGMELEEVDDRSFLL